MHAVLLHQFGGPEELKYEETADPEINPDDVLIKVYAASINPIDWKIRQGQRKGAEAVFPMILGRDVSGVIEAVGSQVTSFQQGDEVFSCPGISRNGTYAEFVAVRAGEVALKPRSVGHELAAAIPLTGQTAWQGIFDHGGLQSGQKILIHGAAGGVGSMAVQLAKWKGAYVIGTASAKNSSFLKDLGADEVIDYTTEDFSEKLKDIDLVFDTIGGDTQERSLKVLRPGGILVSTVGIKDPSAITAKGLREAHFMAHPDAGQLQELAELIDKGKIRPVVSKIMPLKDAAEAHRLSEEGHTRGKIVLQVYPSMTLEQIEEFLINFPLFF
jgi:NADPH:quinone reductase-like Zn-dependent oxidoreductase